ncbi:MAG: GspH/FimT family pseudopilin [Candidatus Competibacteraceae bacterium]|nr:GspH/FimT family pseudopilin [Candidatus Competibacteraceae bacterium]
MRSQQTGLTLIELTVTLAVMVTLVGTATPGFRSLLENNHLTAQANALHADLLYARAEAVRRAATVRVVARDGDWSQGWNVVNPNLAEDHPDRLIKAGSLSEYDLELTGAVTAVDYSGSGVLADLQPIDLTVCAASGQGRRIAIQGIGRVEVERISDCGN